MESFSSRLRVRQEVRIKMLVKLGGKHMFLGARGTGAPSHQKLWHGWKQLMRGVRR